MLEGFIFISIMSWKREAKDITRSYYGGYCKMCRELKLDPVPYHQFNMDEYNKVINLKNKGLEKL